MINHIISFIGYIGVEEVVSDNNDTFQSCLL